MSIKWETKKINLKYVLKNKQNERNRLMALDGTQIVNGWNLKEWKITKYSQLFIILY